MKGLEPHTPDLHPLPQISIQAMAPLLLECLTPLKLAAVEATAPMVRITRSSKVEESRKILINKELDSEKRLVKRVELVAVMTLI